MTNFKGQVGNVLCAATHSGMGRFQTAQRLFGVQADRQCVGPWKEWAGQSGAHG